MIFIQISFGEKDCMFRGKRFLFPRRSEFSGIVLLGRKVSKLDGDKGDLPHFHLTICGASVQSYMSFGNGCTVPIYACT